ncbi:unnamed protein product [Allacma fusca]|uniref:DNA-directed DNA polymerase n=1 Tax=Allacma fusca TaxID=39272 RepID=A0A8J2L191_9HEXA|nr:unnamed protein product [Allacma fusca]
MFYIVGKGRDILLKTKDQVEKMGFEVIYGDTDSLMINSHTQDIQQVFQIGNKIKSEINRTYRLLELEIDGVFRFLLLLKKKKYAAMLCNLKPGGEKEYVLELKGLDMVRRDWAPIASSTARACLDEIMSEQPLDDKIFKVCKVLNDVGDQLREGKIPLKELLITKQLAKHPEEYKNSAGLYHVKVALRMNESGKMPKKFRNGDTVSYLFCTDGEAHHLTELGKPIEIKKDQDDGTDEKEVKQLTPDPIYYLANQVHPVVSRICDPIPGLDPARIADSLGLDSSSYKRRRVVEENEDKFLGHQSEAEKYTDCEKLTFQCAKCSTLITLTSPLFRKKGKLEFCLATCPNENCVENPWGSTINFKNKLTIFIRKFITRYYKNTFICEDPSCSGVTSTMPLYLERGYPVCACKQALMYKEFSDAQLYRQLNYLHFVFDLYKSFEELTKDEKDELKRKLHNKHHPGKKDGVELIYEDLQSFVKNTLDHSAYSHIDLKNIFSLISTRKADRTFDSGSVPSNHFITREFRMKIYKFSRAFTLWALQFQKSFKIIPRKIDPPIKQHNHKRTPNPDEIEEIELIHEDPQLFVKKTFKTITSTSHSMSFHLHAQI